MKLVKKFSVLFFALFLFAQVSQAQCLNTTIISSPKKVCEVSYSTHVIVYDNSGTLSFNVDGGTIVMSKIESVNARLDKVSIRILWNATPGVSNTSGSIEVVKNGVGCVDSEVLSVLILDSTNGFCS